MLRSAKPHLVDILEAIQGIEETVAGFDLSTYRTSWHVRRAVERGLEIISEASRRIPEQLKERANEVPWTEIAGIGNVLRHEYHRVDDHIVWNIVREHLPQLAAGTSKLLDYLAAQDK
jgi:uncharacterized protein with HEPN domain